MTEPTHFEHGRHQGVQDRQLQEHQNRLDKINGTIVQFTEAMHGHTLAIQQLRSDFTSAAERVIATAKTLKEAAATQRQVDADARQLAERKWFPWGNLFIVLSVLIALAGLILVLVLR